MSDKFLHIEIVTPEKQYTFEKAFSFYGPGAEGYFEILPNHAPYMVELLIGEVIINDHSGKNIFAISGGICEVNNNEVRVFTNSAENLGEIDLERALKAKERAEKRLLSKDPGTDVDRAKLALYRALNRIKIVEKYRK